MISATEIRVECTAERQEGTKTVKLSLSKPFRFQNDIDVPGVTSVLSSEGILNITVPKKIPTGRGTTPIPCFKDMGYY